MSMEDLDRSRVFGDDIMNNHVGSNNFRHSSYPHMQYSNLLRVPHSFCLDLGRCEIKELIPTSLLRYCYYSTYGRHMAMFLDTTMLPGRTKNLCVDPAPGAGS